MTFTTVQGASASDATSFIGSAGVDTVNLNNVGTPIWLGAQAAGDVISFESSTRTVSNLTLVGGQGIDRLSVSDGATSLTNSFINLNKDNDVMQLLNVSSSTIYGGAGSDDLTTGELRFVRFNSNKGDDTTTVAGATGSSIFGGAGSDITTLNGNYSNSVIQGDKENDTLTFSIASSLSSTTVNGNAGNDTINVNAIASFGASTLFGGQGNDSVNAANSAVGVFASGDAGDDTVAGGAGNDTQLGGSGADNLFGNTGADSLVGGSGDDFFVYRGTANVVAGETIEGGATGQTNGDTILVQTANTDFANLTTATIRTAGGVENIQLTSGFTGSFLGSQLTGQAISVNGAGAAGNSTLDVNATTAVAVDLSNLTFTAVGAGTAFAAGDVVRIDSTAGVNTNVTGTTFTDIMNGNTGADTLSGGNSNDTITGGAASDALNGGVGNDTFRYTTAATSVGAAGVNTDLITGFTSTADTIGLQQGAGTLLAGVTIDATSTAAVFAANVVDATAVATLADVYTAIGANAAFNVGGNFAASAAVAGAGQLIGKTISFANGAAAGTYLVINDQTAAFQAANDLVIGLGTGVVAAAAGDIVTFA